jgi:UDP-N-acetylmuramate dehydrogenase
MNASAFGYEIGSIVKKVVYFSLKEKEIKEDISPRFSYRKSPYDKDTLLLEIFIELKKARKNIREEIFKIREIRKKKQPIEFPSAGSTFKNPSNSLPAGYLLEKVGFKGYCSSGGLCFSRKHANFLVNISKKATFDDVLLLIEKAKEKILKEFGIILEEEIILVPLRKR